MAFIAATAAIGLGSAAFKIGHGIHQKNLARKAEKNNIRPTMAEPAALREEADNARQQAGTTRIPGQSYAENQIGAQSARDVNRITQTGGSTGEIINGIGRVDENARGATNDLAFQGAQLNQQNQAMYRGVLDKVADNQMQRFDYNQNQPYQTKFLQNQQLKQSGNANITNGIDTLGDTASNIGVASGYRKAQKIREQQE